jgi:hypothetical protein
LGPVGGGQPAVRVAPCYLAIDDNEEHTP